MYTNEFWVVSLDCCMKGNIYILSSHIIYDETMCTKLTMNSGDEENFPDIDYSMTRGYNVIVLATSLFWKADHLPSSSRAIDSHSQILYW